MKRPYIAKFALCIWLYAGWWGLVYPQLVITSDTCSVVCEDETEEEQLKRAEQMTAEQLYRALQEAEPGQVRYRSKLLELLEKLWK
ncbi:MAG: hypothetical protein HDR02_05475 [Lachnospiraceae bacterium]|nr:hypothetical protein [Lachnospiraceae bacterium]